THAPCMTLGVMTQLHNQIAVTDIGLDGRTGADGLAVARPSKLVGHIMNSLLYGAFTVEDQQMYRYLYLLSHKERILREPSAASVFAVLQPVLKHTDKSHFNLSQVNHNVWATGSNLVTHDGPLQHLAQGEHP